MRDLKSLVIDLRDLGTDGVCSSASTATHHGADNKQRSNDEATRGLTMVMPKFRKIYVILCGNIQSGARTSSFNTIALGMDRFNVMQWL